MDPLLHLVRTSVVPGDDDKRDPERESWPCRVMLPILPIQSISGSRLLPSPGKLAQKADLSISGLRFIPPPYTYYRDFESNKD